MSCKHPKYFLQFFLFVLIFPTVTRGQLSQCKAVLVNDTLTLENSKIKRCFLWNGGELQSLSILNKINKQTISGAAETGKPDVAIPGLKGKAEKAFFRVYEVASNSSSYAYLAAEVIIHTGGIELKRIFKIYADCPAIACDYYMRGKAGDWGNVFSTADNLKNIEDENSKSAVEGRTMITDKITVSGNHWQVRSVEFFDATDYNNNLVQENPRLIYRQDNRMRGNLLLAGDKLTNAGFFILKEAPTSNIQLYYQGFDFTVKWGAVKVAGLGISPGDLSDSIWAKGYSVVVGVNESKGDMGLLASLRNYQRLQRVYKEDRDAMIVANTWGDRNRDSRIKEEFILQEIDAAAKLGITHLQIDDGWQVGISSNSALGGSLTNIWRNPRYWQVDSLKFPGGLEKILAAAKKKGIQITLWFNPSTDSSFANWEKDADVLIAQYKRYGVSMWKIDGVQVTDKKGEINFRQFLDKVMMATHNEAVFNLDVTAGRRFGYHFMHTYGNLFLENRYTDWGNYYPHYTLRNLWQLSKYIPAQRLQIEFLNKWRNAAKYPAGDILSPVNYSFDYLFAITMVAQPLAWFEVSGLPAEAISTTKLIGKYKTIRSQLHEGEIFPVGDEPNGFNWTGFQSIRNDKGYLLIFRENNANQKKLVKTNLPHNKKIKLRLIAGEGKSFNTITDQEGSIQLEITKQKAFALYEYTIL
ncbi:MAG: alpha-galactosidase [Ferruginibacter sp.]|nr:alpha-galactosidase [Ferruginibacter sp.]